MNDKPTSFWLAALVVAAALFRAPAFAAATDLPPVIPPPPSGVALTPVALPPPLPPVMDASFPHGIRLTEFARVVLADVLKQPFVFSSDFLASPSQVGFSAKQLRKNGSEELLRDVLAEHGFSLEFSRGYYRVFRVRDIDKPDLREDFYYRPKHRDLAYLSRMLQPLFPEGGFTHQRSANVRSSSREQYTGAEPSSSRPVDDGKSVYSMTTSADADALLFRGLPEDIDRLKRVLEQIDTAVPRVLVRALVLEVQNRETAGFSISAVARILSGRLGVAIGGASGFANALSFKTGSFDAVASALSADGGVRILTAPSAYVQTGARARLGVGASVPTLGAIQYSGDGGRSQQSVEYRDTGVLLDVAPRVFDDAITLDITQELSDAVQTTTGVSGSPTLTKRSLSSTLNMSSGEWVILGGLTTDKRVETVDSAPFFPSIKFGSYMESDKLDIVVLLYVERS